MVKVSFSKVHGDMDFKANIYPLKYVAGLKNRYYLMHPDSFFVDLVLFGLSMAFRSFNSINSVLQMKQFQI